MIRDSVAREARDSIYAAAARPVHHRSVNVRVPFSSLSPIVLFQFVIIATITFITLTITDLSA